MRLDKKQVSLILLIIGGVALTFGILHLCGILPLVTGLTGTVIAWILIGAGAGLVAYALVCMLRKPKECPPDEVYDPDTKKCNPSVVEEGGVSGPVLGKEE